MEIVSAYRAGRLDTEDILSSQDVHLGFLMVESVYITVRMVDERILSVVFVELELEMAILKPSIFEASCMLVLVAAFFCVTQSFCSEHQDSRP